MRERKRRQNKGGRQTRMHYWKDGAMRGMGKDEDEGKMEGERDEKGI